MGMNSAPGKNKVPAPHLEKDKKTGEEFEPKLALVRKEIETFNGSDWWLKEYEGYDIGEDGKKDLTEAEEFMKSLPDEDRTIIVSQCKKTESRYKEYRSWLTASGMAQKYGGDKIDKVVWYFSTQKGLKKYLEEKEQELLK